MAYADYSFYIGGDFGGIAIAQEDFARLALRASVIIDQVTFGRASAVVTAGIDTATITKIKQATCAVAEELYQLEQSGGAVQSERVGNVSVTYQAPRSESQRLLSAAALFLVDTGLMFRGLNDGE